MKNKNFFIVLSVMFFTENVSATANCPNGTTVDVNCWSCGQNCTAYLSDIKDAQGNTVNVTGTNTPAQKLTVTGTGDMQNYSVIPVTGVGNTSSAPWYASRDSITNIEVEQGITSLGAKSFAFMANVTDVQLPNGLEKLGDHAFHSCYNLTSIDIPDSVKSIEAEAFSDSRKLTSVTLPENLKTISSNVFGNTNLQNIAIPDNVTSIADNVFGGIDVVGGYYNKTSILNIYCDKNISKQCEDAVQWMQDLGRTVNVNLYQKSEGKLFYNNKWYDNANDIMSGNHFKKRIYTIDEANQVTGNKNSIHIRYK